MPLNLISSCKHASDRTEVDLIDWNVVVIAGLGQFLIDFCCCSRFIDDDFFYKSIFEWSRELSWIQQLLQQLISCFVRALGGGGGWLVYGSWFTTEARPARWEARTENNGSWHERANLSIFGGTGRDRQAAKPDQQTSQNDKSPSHPISSRLSPASKLFNVLKFVLASLFVVINSLTCCFVFHEPSSILIWLACWNQARESNRSTFLNKGWSYGWLDGRREATDACARETGRQAHSILNRSNDWRTSRSSHLNIGLISCLVVPFLGVGTEWLIRFWFDGIFERQMLGKGNSCVNGPGRGKADLHKNFKLFCCYSENGIPAFHINEIWHSGCGEEYIKISSSLNVFF